MFEKVKNFVKKNKKKIVIGGLTTIAAVVVAGLTIKGLKSEGDRIEAEGKKILEALEKSDIDEFHYEKIDNKDMYDDKEFYELTHNKDGSLNEYGKSLDD